MAWDDLGAELSEMFDGLFTLHAREEREFFHVVSTGVVWKTAEPPRQKARKAYYPFPLRKLSDEDARCALLILGTDPDATHGSVADHFKVSREAIQKLASGLTYKELSR